MKGLFILHPSSFILHPSRGADGRFGKAPTLQVGTSGFDSPSVRCIGFQVTIGSSHRLAKPAGVNSGWVRLPRSPLPTGNDVRCGFTKSRRPGRLSVLVV